MSEIYSTKSSDFDIQSPVKINVTKSVGMIETIVLKQLHSCIVDSIFRVIDTSNDMLAKTYMTYPSIRHNILETWIASYGFADTPDTRALNDCILRVSKFEVLLRNALKERTLLAA